LLCDPAGRSRSDSAVNDRKAGLVLSDVGANLSDKFINVLKRDTDMHDVALGDRRRFTKIDPEDLIMLRLNKVEERLADFSQADDDDGLLLH
jgi:hypothetical protein